MNHVCYQKNEKHAKDGNKRSFVDTEETASDRSMSEQSMNDGSVDESAVAANLAVRRRELQLDVAHFHHDARELERPRRRQERIEHRLPTRRHIAQQRLHGMQSSPGPNFRHRHIVQVLATSTIMPCPLPLMQNVNRKH